MCAEGIAAVQSLEGEVLGLEVDEMVRLLEAVWIWWTSHWSVSALDGLVGTILAAP